MLQPFKNGGLVFMKMNVLRFLILPWLVLFVAIIGTLLAFFIGLNVTVQDAEKPFLIALLLGVFVCLYRNLETLTQAGIWLAHSLPRSLKISPLSWMGQALIALLLAFGINTIGKLSWMPLMWQGIVSPLIYTGLLFFIVRSLMGPVLVVASRNAFTRMTAFFLGLPIFFLVPMTAVFLGNMILTAYQQSRPMHMTSENSSRATSRLATNVKGPVIIEERSPVAEKPDAKLFKAISESGQLCPDDSKTLQASLSSKVSEDVAYWAVKAMKCADLKSVVALPKLAQLMVDHPSSVVRAAAIRMIPRYGIENARSTAYLMIKRMSEKEPREVIQAAAVVLNRLGGEEQKMATARLKALLDHPKTSVMAAQILIETLKKPEIVREYLEERLPVDSAGRKRAIGMICLLSPEDRRVAEPFVDQVVAAIGSLNADDTALLALSCLGEVGLQAIQKEIRLPQRLEKATAARALAEIKTKDVEFALDTAAECSRDADPEVRKFCSQTLGKIGAPALPKILELLKSNDSILKTTGKNAMNHFEDPRAREELQRLRLENSGWMATQKKLQISKAIDVALENIQIEQSQSTAE